MANWREKQKIKNKKENVSELSSYVSIGKVRATVKKDLTYKPTQQKYNLKWLKINYSFLTKILEQFFQSNFQFVLFLLVSFLSLTGVVHAGFATINNSRKTATTETLTIADANILGIQAITSTYSPPSSGFQTIDIREYVFNEYFKQRNSPLAGMANLFTEACDRYGAPRDCLTTVAIARHETDLCKYANSAAMHNCMGWGGAGVNRMQFASFKDHIDRATDVLVNQYGLQYMIDPRLMERVFCGPQAECDNWGNRILYFMDEIDRFGESLGVGRLSALR